MQRPQLLTPNPRLDISSREDVTGVKRRRLPCSSHQDSTQTNEASVCGHQKLSSRNGYREHGFGYQLFFNSRNELSHSEHHSDFTSFFVNRLRESATRKSSLDQLLSRLDKSHAPETSLHFPRSDTSNTRYASRAASTILELSVDG